MALKYESAAHERQYERTYVDIDEAHARAKGRLAEYEIKLIQFAGLYGDIVLKEDAGVAARLAEKYDEQPSKKYADILEAIVCEHGELSEWFGPQSRVIKTSRFDDYINKIDMVVETETDNRQFSHLALGVDVTFGSADLHNKFVGPNGIKARIDAGALGEIKYFHSDRQHFTGRKNRVPQVVVGFEIERVKELALLWMNRRNKELERHAAQVTILEEAELQLKVYADYARKIDQDELVPILEAELQKVRELLNQKRALGIRGLKGDKVFEEIKRNLAFFTDGPVTTS